MIRKVRPRKTEQKPLIIAIDGPAGSGKSSTARELARRLGFVWIDTGAMYRAATLWLLRNAVPPQEGSDLESALKDITIELDSEDGDQRVLLNGEDVTDIIRDPEISRQVSRFASLPAVRKEMARIQKSMAQKGNAVLEGRDIGTVVCPDAPIKVYLSASLEERAKRRAKELRERIRNVDIELLRRDIHRRDTTDSSREHAPLKPADDAVHIDTTDLSFDEQVDSIIALVRKYEEQHR